MIAFLLLETVYSAYRVTASTKQNASFDIHYVTTNIFGEVVREYSTTFADYGWFVVFRIYNGNQPGPLNYVRGADDGIATVDGITVEASPKIDDSTGYLVLEFQVTNSGKEPKRIDLGVFADVQINGNDNADITVLQDQRGITMKQSSDGTGLMFTLLIRDAPGTTNIDSFYYGALQPEWAVYDWYGYFVGYKPNNFPYFKNTSSSASLNQKDSCFAFSWQKRDIYPGKTYAFGTTAGVGANLPLPPRIELIGDFKEVYNPNEDVKFKIKVSDYDTGNVKVCLYDEKTRCDTIYFNKTYNSKIIPTGVNVGKGPIFQFEVLAWDNRFYSNKITKKLVVTSKPIIDIDENRINKIYKKGAFIDILGHVKDDTNVTIKYKFDDDFELEADSDVIVCNGDKKQFKKQLNIPGRIPFGDNHSLIIYAEDSYGVKSNIEHFNFSYKNTNTPEIRNVKFEYDRVQPGQTVTVTGEMRDLDATDDLTLYCQIGYQQMLAVGTKKITNTYWVRFSFNFKIPNNVETGPTKFFFQVKDGDTNSEDQIFDVEIFIPEPTFKRTPSNTPSITPSTTPSITPSTTPSITPSTTPSITPSNTPSITPSTTPSITPSNTPSITPSTTPSITPSTTPSITPSTTPSITPSITPKEEPLSTKNIEEPLIPLSQENLSKSSGMEIEKVDKGQAQKKSDNSLLIIIIAIVVTLVIASVCGVAYFLYRRRMAAADAEEESEVEMEETIITPSMDLQVTLDNPLFSTTVYDEEDPFVNDFEESNVMRYFFVNREN